MHILDGILVLSDAKLNFSRLPTLELVAAASILNKKVVLIQILNDVEDDARIVEHYHEITELIRVSYFYPFHHFSANAISQLSLDCHQVQFYSQRISLLGHYFVSALCIIVITG
jgi:flagellar biosynthesis/type III secretory pathway ATPase